jgi:hypothetical protein
MTIILNKTTLTDIVDQLNKVRFVLKKGAENPESGMGEDETEFLSQNGNKKMSIDELGSDGDALMSDGGWYNMKDLLAVSIVK